MQACYIRESASRAASSSNVIIEGDDEYYSKEVFLLSANFGMELQVAAEIKTRKRCSGRALLHILYEIVPSDNRSKGQVLVCLPGLGLARVYHSTASGVSYCV